MRIVKLILVSLIIFAALFVIYVNIPKNMRYEVEDALERISSPDFDVPLNNIRTRNQNDIITEYTDKGYNLKCYGNLRKEEKIGKYNDYVCWAVIKSLYNDIPARRITFAFYKKNLAHIRFEFPESSFDKLQDNLSRQLKDTISAFNSKKDKYGRKLKVWKVRGGIVTTSKDRTPNQYNILLWTAGHILVKSVIDKKQKGQTQLKPAKAAKGSDSIAQSNK